MKASGLNYRKLFTVAVLVGAASTLASVYFFQVVPDRVSELHSRGFRILARLEKNTYEKKNNVTRTIDQVYSAGCTDRDSYKKRLFEGMSLAPDDPKTIYSHKVLPYYDATEGKWYLHFYGDCKDAGKVRTFRYDVENFFVSLLNYRDDFFQDFIVLKGDTVLYQTKSLIFKNKNAFEVDTILKKKYSSKILFTDYVAVDTLSGTEYYTFYHPFNSASDLGYTICGLVSVPRYTHEKYTLSILQITWASIILMLFVSALPFVKIFTVSKFEPILYIDAVFCGIAILGGSALITLLVILEYYNASEKIKQEHALVSLSDTLQGRIDEEVKQSLIESSYQQGQLIRRNTDWLKKNNAHHSSTENDNLVNGNINQHWSHHLTESILLVDSEGQNWGTWRHKKIRYRPDMNLSTREYVKAFIKDAPKPFKLGVSLKHLDSIYSLPFYMQAVYSWQNQDNTVIYSNEAWSRLGKERLKVFGFETRLFSAMKTSLPHELAFVILDQQGEVIFHSEDKRNLRENFIEEVDQSSLVSQIVRNRMDTTLSLYYYGRNNLAHFRPLSYGGLTLVALGDNLPRVTALANEVTFSVAMLLLLTLFTLTLMFATSLLSRRPAILKRTRVNLVWLRRSVTNDYTFAVMSLLLLIPTVISNKGMGGEHLIYLPFLSAIMVLSICGAALLYCNKQRYDKKLAKGYIYFQFRIFFLLMLSGTALLYKFNLDAQPQLSASFEGITTMVMGVPLIILSIYPKAIHFIPSTLTLIHSLARRIKLLQFKEYLPATALILILINLCIIPTFNFFTFAVRQEGDIKLKRNALEIAKRIDTRKAWLIKTYHEHIPLFHDFQDSLLLCGIYYPNQLKDWISIEDKHFDDGDVAQGLREQDAHNRVSMERIYATIVNAITVSWNEYDAGYLYPRASIGIGDIKLWTWNKQLNQLKIEPIKCCSQIAPSTLSIRLPVPESTINTLSGAQKLSLQLMVAICLVSCCWLIIVVRRRLVLSDYFNHDSLQDEAESDRKFIRKSIATRSNLIVLSLPVKDSISFMRVCLHSEGYKEEEFKEGAEIDPLQKALIPHHMYKDATGKKSFLLLPFVSLKAAEVKQCEEKLDALLHSFIDPDTKVIWLTDTDPCDQVSILGKEYVELLKRNSKEPPKDEDAATQLPDIQSGINKLLRLLEDFQRVIFSLNTNSLFQIDLFLAKDKGATLSHGRSEEHYELEYVDDEFRYGTYFRRLRRVVIKSGMVDAYFVKRDGVWACRFKQAEEVFILKIQEVAMSYYLALWASLSVKEKYVLYDLAKDELTNYNNFPILNALRRKGIVFIDGEDHALKIFNKSFRNFILTVVDPQDALILEKEIKVQGTWDLISTGLVVLFAVVGMILFLTEQSIYNRIFGLVTTMTTLIPTLMKFLTPSKSKSSAA